MGLYGHLNVSTSLTINDQAVYFYAGNVLSRDTSAHLYFLNNAQAFNASAQSYSEARVSIEGQASFQFPSGDLGKYFPLKISEGNAAPLTLQFHSASPPPGSFETGVTAISPHFYWSVNGQKKAKLQLVWTPQAQLEQWNDALEELLLLGFDGAEWISIPINYLPTIPNSTLATSLNQGAIATID